MTRSNKENGDRTLDNYFELNQQYALLVHKYHVIRACIMYLLHIEPEKSVAEYLTIEGYKIEMTKGQNAYNESLKAASIKIQNLITKINSKKNELLELEKGSEGKSETVSFEQALAIISAQMEFPVPSDVTLAGYNQYRKIYKEKIKAHGIRNQERGLNK